MLERFIGDPEAGDVQTQAFRSTVAAVVQNARNDPDLALDAARRALAEVSFLTLRHDWVKQAFVVALEAALAGGRPGDAEEILRLVGDAPPGELTPFLQAQSARFGARLAVAKGGSEPIEGLFKEGAGLFRETGMPFYMAQTLLEHAEWLVSQGRHDEARPLLDEARGIFEQLGAEPYLERAQSLAPDLARA